MFQQKNESTAFVSESDPKLDAGGETAWQQRAGGGGGFVIIFLLIIALFWCLVLLCFDVMVKLKGIWFEW